MIHGPDRLWLACGLLGQALFASRFVLQWARSEAAGRSIVPAGFWYLSLAGSLVLLTYAVHRRDLVFMLGQSSGLLIYVRNLKLIRRASQDEESATKQVDGAMPRSGSRSSASAPPFLSDAR